MIRAVLDTNVLASGFIGEDKPASTPGELVRRWRIRGYRLIVSEHILAELADTFSDPWFARRLTSLQAAEVMHALRLDAIIQPITVEVSGVASHPEDDIVLATALSARATYLVTGDKPLLARGTYGGTRLLSPRQFLAMLDREALG